ncbi:hypothetical protein BKA70DRAFT_1222497 [Coprinopsis sp. MPI-PUGE-AT-0042]|nr:hypothetical protein BKA70DRAFT_1222497 [Coprinopsis sp. MPI-PUGE-AT-0042]
MIPNARLNSYIHDSNDPLPEDRACDHNRQRIEDAIEKRQSQIQALEYEIERLRVVHKQVMNNKASIAIRETQYRATLSPLCRIPPEVIARIMQFAIESDEEYTGQLQRADFKKLRALCRLWQKTAFSTPHLWRSLSLHSSDFPFSQYQTVDPLQAERFARTLTSWFSRGGENAPLSLCLSWVSIEHATWAIQLLRSLEINITTAAVYLESDNWHKGGYYGLKFLELSSPESGGIFPVRDMEIWLRCPSLTILIASGDPPGEMDRGLQLACLQRFVKRSGLSIPFTFYGEARRASER